MQEQRGGETPRTSELRRAAAEERMYAAHMDKTTRAADVCSNAVAKRMQEQREGETPRTADARCVAPAERMQEQREDETPRAAETCRAAVTVHFRAVREDELPASHVLRQKNDEEVIPSYAVL